MSKDEGIIRVAVVDDNKAILRSLTTNLNYSGKTRIVLTASDGDEFLRKMKECTSQDFPQVVITDVNMPGMSGIDVVRHGRALYSHVKFLMLTVADDEETLFDAIKAGASGYLMKDEPIRVIAQHIEHLMSSGSVPMTPRIARKTLELLARSEKNQQSADSPVEAFNLSARELEVLNLLVDGLAYKAIAKKLAISPHTVRKHIANIYDKLHVSTKVQAIRLMQSSGVQESGTKEVTCRIALTDDHQMILDSLEMMISTIPGISVVAKLNDSRRVLPFLEENEIDLLISDVSMPYINGIQLAESVHESFPDLKILMLTVSEDREQVRQARAAGAHGYILKKAGKNELATAIDMVMHGKLYYNDSLLAF